MSYDYRNDPLLGPGLAYWLHKRGSRAVPRKADIDPIELPPKLLPNMQIIEVVDGGARFRYRLVGTALVDAYGKDFTGKHPDELFPDDRLRFIQSIYRRVHDTKQPLFTHNKYHTPKNIDVYALRIYLPLSDNDSEVTHIMAVLRFESGGPLNEGMWGEGAQMDPEVHYIETIAVDSAVFEAAD